MRPRLAPLVLLASCATGPAPEGSWSIEAELVESCCCDAICPCLVGSPSTKGYCTGNRLVEIERGHFGDVNLAGVSLVLVFHVREWSKIYVSDEATEEQMVAVRKLLEKQRGWTYDNVLETKRVPLTVRKTATTIEYSVPDASTAVEVMKGEDGGPIRIANLPSRFRDYVQYKSTKVTHTGGADEKTKFEFSGTNGFLAQYVGSN